VRRTALAVAVLAALVLGGCGIPEQTDVRVLGAGPAAGPAQDDDSSPPDPVRQDSTRDYRTFVLDYLMAAAGDDLEGARAQRVTDFMAPALKASFTKSNNATNGGVHVVRPTEETPLYNPGESDVSFDVQEIGILSDDGQLVPSLDRGTIVLKFKIVSGEDGLHLQSAPNYMLLSQQGLERYYQQHTIYFWNVDNTGLVPDVRYLPRSVPRVQQPTMILKWLAGGPAAWLKQAAHGFPTGTTANDNIPAISNGRLQIKLSASAVTPGDNGALDRLRRQLLWSLGAALVPSTLELKIGPHDPVSYTGSSYLDSNRAYRLQDKPDEFVVYNGSIRRLSDTPHDADLVPLLKPAANRTIQSAALSTSGQHTFAAVVTGSGASTALRVAVAPTGQQADLKAVPGLTGSLGHPAWAVTAAGDTDTAIGLVTAQSHLYSFGTGGAPAQPVEWPDGDPGPISSFSIAPDGYRVALVASGKLYRAVLTSGGNGVVLSERQQLVPPGLGSLSAVAWSSEGTLAVSGVATENKRVAIYDVSIDAATSVPRLGDMGTEAVTYLTAYPINPATTTQLSGAAVAYVAHGAAWNAAGYAARITPTQLAVPSPGAAPGSAVPTAPFFLN
jgi:Lipoprotein LpqB beta-propeller domain